VRERFNMPDVTKPGKTPEERSKARADEFLRTLNENAMMTEEEKEKAAEERGKRYLEEFKRDRPEQAKKL
jgi:hypothetical protein